MTTDEVKERLANLSEADWVRKMKEHYARTGAFRAEDLRRLLGDPTRGVQMRTIGSSVKQFMRGR